MGNQTPVKKQPTALQKMSGFLSGDQVLSKIQSVMAGEMTAQRVTQVALLAANRTPKIADTTPGSILQCLMDCSSLGLEPDSRNAYLIPYGKSCTLIVGYKGLILLIRRSGEVSVIYSQIVYENDGFEVSFGSGGGLRHVPVFKDRGEIKLVYSFVQFKDGSEDWEIMTLDEVEAIRSRSKSANNGPWVTDFGEMAKKTVLRRHSKRMPFGIAAKVEEVMNRHEGFITPSDASVSSSPASGAADQRLEEALGLSEDPEDVKPAEEPPVEPEVTPPSVEEKRKVVNRIARSKPTTFLKACEDIELDPKQLKTFSETNLDELVKIMEA